MEGKTIKQIADELGVSKQAIRKQLHRLPVTEVVTGDNRLTLIKPSGEAILRALVQTKLPPVTGNQPQTVTGNQFAPEKDEEIRFLRGQVEQLQGELAKEREHNREQAEKITELAAKAQALAEHAQTIQLAQLTKGKPLAALMGRRPPLWARLFPSRFSNDERNLDQ